MFPGSTLLENTELRKGINERKVEKPVENSMILNVYIRRIIMHKRYENGFPFTTHYVFFDAPLWPYPC